MMAVNDGRQVILALKNYSGDHEGRYPEGKTANEALRQLVTKGILEEERYFASSGTFARADNDIGAEPYFSKALERGENQWAMTKGLSDKDSGNVPLIFDAPAVKAWPPLWNADRHEMPKKGDVRKGGRVIIGRNDGSVNIEKIEGKGLATVAKDSDGQTLFDRFGPHEILDVEE